MNFSHIVGRRTAPRPDPDGSLAAGTASADARAVAPAARLHFTLRELQARPWAALVGAYAVELAIVLAIGAAFGWMGPFGSYALPGRDRFAFWLLAMPLVGVPASLAIHAATRSAALAAWPRPAQVAAGAVIAAIPGVFIVRALAGSFGVVLDGTLATLPGGYASVAVVTFIVGLSVNAMTQRFRPSVALAAPIPVVPAAPEPPPLGRGGSPFLRRIPPKLGTRLLHIETEDHYLRVHTDRGSDLVLFRLADALAEIDTGLGLQVHRSHWVARAAVATVERNGARTSLRLSTGASVPVSRTFLPALRQAGWL